MGYELPASIGAALGASGQDVFCFTGDGSIMMNLQELQTISYHHLPIKIFVLNNQGYRSIQMTQQSFFNGHLVACDSQHGVGFPDFTKVAAAFGLPTYRLASHKGLAQNIQDLLQTPGPLLCDVVLRRDYIFSPKLSSRKLDDGRMVSTALDDMYPFLPDDEMEKNKYRSLVEQ
jgi:acetolactate synthase-1/2/3 large subunit